MPMMFMFLMQLRRQVSTYHTPVELELAVPALVRSQLVLLITPITLSRLVLRQLLKQVERQIIMI